MVRKKKQKPIPPSKGVLMQPTKYLVIQIRDAKLFRFRQGPKDTHNMVIAGTKEPTKRKDAQGVWVDCPPNTFLASSVSGMLHALAGERPVPTIRKNTLLGSPQRVERIDELAKGTLVQITSGISLDSKTGEVQYFPKYGEVLMVRKASTLKTDSVYPSSYPLSLGDPCPNTRRLLTWDRFKAHIGAEAFEKVTSLFSEEACNEPTLIKALIKVRQNLSPELVAYATTLKDPWKSLILNGYIKDASPLRNGYNGIERMTFRMTVPRGKEMVSIRDAVLFVPVTDGDIEMFRTGSSDKTFQNEDTAKSVLKNQKKV
jgi:hypothetical protein